MTLADYKRYVIYAIVGIAVVVGVFFLGKLIWHEATKERPHWNSGKIVQRDFSPAHTETYMVQQYAGEDCSSTYDSYTKSYNRTCSPRYIWVPRTDYIPDEWSIQIENCDVHHKDGRQWVDKHGVAKCFHKWIDVDQMAYNSNTTQIGVVWGVPGT